MADEGTSYGLDPAIVSYLQGGGMPMTDQVTSSEYGVPAGAVAGSLPSSAPFQLPPQGLPPFIPPPPARGQPTVPDYTPPLPFQGQIPGVNPRPYPPLPLLPSQATGGRAESGKRQAIGQSDTPGGEIAPPINATPADYGIPPSVVDAIQGGFVPVARQAPPDQAPVTLNLPPVDKSNAAYDKQQAAQKAYDATPGGIADAADAQQRQAIDEQRAALANETQAQIDANNAKVKAETEFKQKNAAALADDAAKEQKHQETVAKLQQDYDQKAKAAADYKVDTNRDIGLRGMIAIALSGIGDALDHRHGPNAAAAILDQMADKHIDDQWRQKGEIGKQAEAAQSNIDHYIRQFGDERTAREGQRAAMRLQLADEVQRVADASANPQIKARAQQTAAALTQQAAAITSGTAQRKAGEIRAAQEEKDKQAEIAIQRGHLGLAGEQLAYQKQTGEREWALKLDDHAREWAALGDKEAAAKAKETAANGVFDATTGNGVLTGTGQAKMDRADALEVQARNLDPAAAQRVRDQAKQLRMDAETNDTFTIADKDIRKEMVASVGAGQKLINIVDRIKGALAADPSSLDRTTWAGIETDFESAKADWIALHKGKPSSREFDAIEPMFGDDPSSLTARVAGRGKMIEALAHLRTSAISDTTADLRANGYKGQWRPHGVDAQGADVLTGKTGLEAGQEAVHPLGDTPLSFTSNAQRSLQAENNSEVTNSGLAKQDDAAVQKQIDRYNDAPDAERAKILTQLTAYATSDRPGVSQGAIALMRQNPEIYKQVTSALPLEQQSALKAIDAGALSSSPIDMLKRSAKSGDVQSAQEILRRAHAGDRDAMAARVELFGGKR